MLKVAGTLLRKRLGFRYRMSVIPTDPSLVRGSHGRRGGDPQRGAVLLSSGGAPVRDRMAATDVRNFLLGRMGLGN